MISKVIKSSRAYPLGKVDCHQLYCSPENFGHVFLVKKCEEFYDVLCFFISESYLCRYKFPIDWKLDDVFKFCFENGTFQRSFERTEEISRTQKK